MHSCWADTLVLQVRSITWISLRDRSTSFSMPSLSLSWQLIISFSRAISRSITDGSDRLKEKHIKLKKASYRTDASIFKTLETHSEVTNRPDGKKAVFPSLPADMTAVANGKPVLRTVDRAAKIGHLGPQNSEASVLGLFLPYQVKQCSFEFTVECSTLTSRSHAAAMQGHTWLFFWQFV